MCLHNEVAPNYINLRTANRSLPAKRAQAYGIKKWITLERKILFNKRDIYNVYLKVIHSELLYRLSSIEFDILDYNVRSQIEDIVHKKYLKQKTKLNNLISNKEISKPKSKKNLKPDHTFYNRFVNLTETTFSKEETQLLEKGFNYNLKPTNNKNNLEMLGVECELALINKPDSILDKCLVAKTLTSHVSKLNSNNEHFLAKNIKQKSIDNNIIFTRADKGKSVIALNQNEYISKTNNFLNPDSYTVLKFDPTNIYQKQIKNLVRDSIIFEEKEKFLLTLMNPQAPKLYSLIKLHKDNMPIRPVVSFITAPSVKVSNRLIEIIQLHTNFTPKFSILNSFQLIDKIQNINVPPNSKLISFDVQNLFPSIPPNDVINIINNTLIKNKINHFIKENILDALTIALDQNYFEFNDKFFAANNGLIMGNPLSPLCAEIFMNHLEELIHKHPFINQFLFWHRYVDDILACFIGTDRQLNLFLEYINNIHKRIKFTLEIEQNNSINFLDLTITKSKNRFEFSIYHKPSHTDTVIHQNSFHPYSHKMAAFHSQIHRLLNVPMNDLNFRKELNIIKQIAKNNGYDDRIIDRLLHKKQMKKAINLVYPLSVNKNTKFNTLTYCGLPSYKVSRHLENIGLKVAFKTNNSLGKIIKNNKTKTKKHNKSGVYKLKCGSCPKVYIGQTGRTFKQRIKEHKKAFENKTEVSHYASHLFSENHTFDENFEILHINNKNKKLNLLESLEINKLKDSEVLLNNQLDLSNTPLLNLKFC